MSIAEIEELSNDNNRLFTLPQYYFNCLILFEGGAESEGLIHASDEFDAIMKAFNSLKDQGVLEIVVNIDCVLLEEKTSHA